MDSAPGAEKRYWKRGEGTGRNCKVYLFQSVEELGCQTKGSVFSPSDKEKTHVFWKVVL